MTASDAVWRPALALLVLAAAWELAARWSAIDGFPTASASLRQLPVILLDPAALAQIGASLARMAAGIGLALLVAVPLGLAMGRSEVLDRAVSPLLTAIYPVPKAALMPIVMLWFGIGDLSKVLVIFLGVSLPLVLHSHHGAASIDRKLIWSARAMGAGPWTRLWRVVLPGALPEVLLGCRVGLAMAMIVMISSEMIARQSGVGNLLFNALDMALYEEVYAVIVVLAGLGFLLDLTFERLRRRLVRWAEPDPADVLADVAGAGPRGGPA